MQYQDYFKIENQDFITGQCLNFISQSQKNWRVIEEYQKHPYQRISLFNRNKKYTYQNVRTPQTLKKCLSYLIKMLFPILIKKSLQNKQKQKLAVTLQAAIIAIRIQYFVQGLIYPKQLIKILKCQSIIYIFLQNKSVLHDFIGLQYLIGQRYKQIMKRNYYNQYVQGLKFGIFLANKNQFQIILANNQIVFSNNELQKIVEFKRQQFLNNYQKMYQSLLSQQSFILYLNWLYISKNIDNFINIIKKSYGNVEKSWIYRRLGLDWKEKQGFINLKQIKQKIVDKYYGFRAWIPHQRLLKSVQELQLKN